jgi:hypothetical protein
MQPTTRWVPPHPFGGVPAAALPPQALQTPEGKRPEWGRKRTPADSQACIAGLLMNDLDKGHRFKAIRHFLMLRALGTPLPPPTESRCVQLLECCPPHKRRRIADDVMRWIDMLDKRHAFIH